MPEPTDYARTPQPGDSEQQHIAFRRDFKRDWARARASQQEIDRKASEKRQIKWREQQAKFGQQDLDKAPKTRTELAMAKAKAKAKG